MSLQNYTKNNYLNKKPQKIGIGSYYFLSIVEYDENYENTVTKEPIENGSTVSDHMIIQPETIKITGIVGQENIFLENVSTELNKIIEPIARLENYGGTYTNEQLIKIADDLDDGKSNLDYINSKISDGSYFANEFGVKKADDFDDPNKQLEEFLIFINGIKKSKLLVQIETPFEVLDDMAITSISLIQSNDKALSFTITAEEFIKVETQYTDVQKKTKNPSSAIDGQADTQISVGTQNGKDVTDQAQRSQLLNLIGVYKQ